MEDAVEGAQNPRRLFFLLERLVWHLDQQARCQAGKGSSVES